jgi:hypothetical protein
MNGSTYARGRHGQMVRVSVDSSPRPSFNLKDEAEERVWSAAYISASEHPKRDANWRWIHASDSAMEAVQLFREVRS